MYDKGEYQLKIIRIIANRSMWINPLKRFKNIFDLNTYLRFGPNLLETVLNRSEGITPNTIYLTHNILTIGGIRLVLTTLMQFFGMLFKVFRNFKLQRNIVYDFSVIAQLI